MIVPTKKKLYERIAELERENLKLAEKIDQEKQKYWKEFLPQAYEVCRRKLKIVFPNCLVMLRFEHVDEGGYWFTFQLTNDTKRQTYAIRHSDLREEGLIANERNIN